MGITAQDLTPELAQAFGLKEQRGTVIADIAQGSPAATAGLRVGDIILSLNDRPVESAAEVRNRIGLLRAGEPVRLTVPREGRQLQIATTLQPPKLTAVEGQSLHPRLTGASFSDIVEGMPEYGRVAGASSSASWTRTVRRPRPVCAGAIL